jgi:hypothetical protein
LHLFNDKEVLLKIISFNLEELGNNNTEANKLKLVEDISIATNQQSPVSEADRRANDKVQIELQNRIFEEFGLYYERKRGEFGDGLRQGYIDRSKIIDREQFLRICLSTQNNPVIARSGSVYKLFLKNTFDGILPDATNYRKYIFAYKAFEKIPSFSHYNSNANNIARHAITSVISNRFNENIQTEQFDENINKELEDIVSKWTDFESVMRNNEENKLYYFKEIYDKGSGQKIIETNWGSYYKGRTLIKDLNDYFKLNSQN